MSGKRGRQRTIYLSEQQASDLERLRQLYAAEGKKLNLSRLLRDYVNETHPIADSDASMEVTEEIGR